ncbi:hypothetical protein M404DRAFT_31019 [Pisolithus tinctorius Marx 270]|uniref:Uncharacterized protein n=1 Tax=Pisolithus tinctorius Marx 270 TaxID=870435 RepID=A0A0C3IPN2_PISTI|nr:hypothetical protein M404DRAFT_31019 [Pisolithus tinctorius Marx 270]
MVFDDAVIFRLKLAHSHHEMNKNSLLHGSYNPQQAFDGLRGMGYCVLSARELLTDILHANGRPIEVQDLNPIRKSKLQCDALPLREESYWLFFFPQAERLDGLHSEEELHCCGIQRSNDVFIQDVS